MKTCTTIIVTVAIAVIIYSLPLLILANPDDTEIFNANAEETLTSIIQRMEVADTPPLPPDIDHTENDPAPQSLDTTTTTMIDTWTPDDTNPFEEALSGDTIHKRRPGTKKKHRKPYTFIGLTRTFRSRKDVAILYWNGKEAMRVLPKKRRRFRVVKRLVKPGDVIAVYARGNARKGRHGVLVVMKRPDGSVIKSGDGGFKGAAATRIGGWKNMVFKPACKWKGAKVSFKRGVKRYGNARLIWAKGVSFKRSVFLRYVFGVEAYCGNGVATTPTASPSVGGSISKKWCWCRETSGERSGVCYRYVKGKLWKGRKLGKGLRACVKGPCHLPYECVENGESYTNRCYYKFSREVIVRKGKPLFRGVFQCKTMYRKKRLQLVLHET